MWGLSQAQFLKEVSAGTLPPPIQGLKCKRPRWSLRSLERAMDDRDGSGTVASIADPLMNEIRKSAARVA
jgi:hypothetical protein